MATGRAPGRQLEGPADVAAVIEQLADFELPAAAWERDVLPARVSDYRPRWLDDLALRGTVAWGRLGAGARLRGDDATAPQCGATEIAQVLTARGALSPLELQHATG